MSITRRSFIKTGTASLAALSLGPKAAAATAPGDPQELKSLTAGVEPLAPEDFALRREKARRLLAEQGLDAVFIGGGTNLLYFTKVGWWLSERVFGVVLSRKKDPVWVCPAFEAERAKELVPSGQEIRVWDEHESPYALIGGIMKDLGAATGKLATAPDLRAFEVHGLRRTLAAMEIVDGAPVTEGCRGVKTDKEIAFMDLANRITKLAYREGFKSMRAGMTTRDLSGAIAAATQKLGSSRRRRPAVRPELGLPPRLPGPPDPDGRRHRPRRRRLRRRGLPLGRHPDGRLRPADGQATPGLGHRPEGPAGGLAAARPGCDLRVGRPAARKVVEDAGFGPGYKYFAHRLGHGIGMEGHEYPYLVKGNTLKIEPGMTFSNEPGIYIYGEFGVRIEDCMVVTETGARHLGGLEAESIERPFGQD